MPSGFTSARELSKQLTETRENVIEMSKGQSAGGKKNKITQRYTQSHMLRALPVGKGRQKGSIGLHSVSCPWGCCLGAGRAVSTACCLQSHRWQLSLLWPSGLKLGKLGKRSKHETFSFSFLFFFNLLPLRSGAPCLAQSLFLLSPRRKAAGMKN